MQERSERLSYDQLLKSLLTRAHDGFLALVAPDLRWRRERSPELPAVKRQADLVWEVEREDGRPGLLHVELQTAVDRGIGERLAEYGIRCWREYHLPVRSVVVYVREARNVPDGPFIIAWGDDETLRYRFDVVRLWTIPRERVLATEHYGLWPLAALMADVTEETMLATAEQIARAPAPLHERSDLAGVLALLASRRLSADVVQQLLRRNRMLDELIAESPLAELWKEQAKRELARDALEGRFGSLPEDIVAAVQEADEATVRALVRHISTDTMEQVRERLGLGR